LLKKLAKFASFFMEKYVVGSKLLPNALTKITWGAIALFFAVIATIF